MSQKIHRSHNEPKREGLSWDQRWKGHDRGLITCWEVGRELREKRPELAELVEKGELPSLGWKGGVDKALKKKEKYGTLFYLAQWQGLCGQDLNINLGEETQVVCSRTGVKVIFTSDVEKYGSA